MNFKIIENIYLQSVLYCGLISGCFPSVIPLNLLSTGTLFTYKFWSVINIFSILLCLASSGIGIGTCFLIMITVAGDNDEPQKVSEFILVNGTTVIITITDLLIRIISLFHCSEIIQLLKLCNFDHVNKGYPQSRRFILSLTIVASSSYIAKSISILINTYVFQEQSIIQKSESDILNNFLVLCIFSSDILTTLSRYFAFGLPMILGIKITNTLENACNHFLEEMLVKSSIRKSKLLVRISNNSEPEKGLVQRQYRQLNSEVLRQFHSEFNNIKIGFTKYNKIAGRFIVVIILLYVIIFINNIYDMFSPVPMNGKFSDIFGIIESLLLIFTLSHLGTFINTKVSQHTTSNTQISKMHFWFVLMICKQMYHLLLYLYAYDVKLSMFV